MLFVGLWVLPLFPVSFFILWIFRLQLEGQWKFYCEKRELYQACGSYEFFGLVFIGSFCRLVVSCYCPIPPPSPTPMCFWIVYGYGSRDQKRIFRKSILHPFNLIVHRGESKLLRENGPTIHSNYYQFSLSLFEKLVVYLKILPILIGLSTSWDCL